MLCNKKEYRNWNVAIKAIAAMKAKGKKGEWACYYCPSHNSYHITSHAKGNSKFLKFKDAKIIS